MAQVKIKTKKTTTTKTRETVIPKRKLTSRGNIGAGSQEETIPQRKLTPRGNVAAQGQGTQEEAIPQRKLTPQGNMTGQEAETAEEIPRRELTPRGETELENGEEEEEKEGEKPEEEKPGEEPKEGEKEAEVEQPEGKGGEGAGATEGTEEAQEKPEPEKKPGHETTPSVSDSDLKNKKSGTRIPTSKEDLKREAARRTTEPLKKAAKKAAKEAAKKALQAIGQALADAGAALVAFFGWPVLLIVIGVVILILIFCFIMFSISAKGYFGKASPVPAGTISTNEDIQKAIDYSKTPNGVLGYARLKFLDEKDRDYMENSGSIDSRLVKSLDYLISKHKYIRISHIISEYEYMNIAEAGSDTNPQIIPNISAHQDGLAADIDEIDYVYRVIEPDAKCDTDAVGSIGAALGVTVVVGGVGSGDSDIVYYNDENKELLRLYCQASVANIAKDTNTTFNSKPAIALPIKILFQDCKPDIKHAGNASDPCKTITDATQKLVYEKVYQPEARRKVHQVIAEMLQWPYDTDNADYYKVTQLITFSYQRDVRPFEDNGTLDKLYGLPRPANYGLFYMLEAWQNIHIAY